jgi:hypothetical protein
VITVTDALGTATVAPTAGTSARPTLHQAVLAAMAAWDDEVNRETDIIAALEGPMAVLCSVPTQRAPRPTTGAPRTPRTGTKQETVLALLRPDEGASGPQIAEAAGWAAHTVRGFPAGLTKQSVIVALCRVFTATFWAGVCQAIR